MKHIRQRVLALLCLSALLLLGCRQETDPSVAESQVWNTMPQLTYGVWESEQLSVQPWYSGRCEATSGNKMAETELGVYTTYDGTLYYADKADLSTWVPVCNEPDCNHRDVCSANVFAGAFLIREGRIIYWQDTLRYKHMHTYDGSGTMLISTAADGSDARLEYLLPEALLPSAGSSGFLLLPDQAYQAVKELKPDGSYTTRLFRITEQGAQMLYCIDDLDPSNLSPSLMTASSRFNIRGDTYIFDTFAQPAPKTMFRFDGDERIELKIEGLPGDGAYVSGSTLRYYVPNDGYYDRNLETGEEVRLADARLADSSCELMLPNCIIESNLLNTTHLNPRPDSVLPAIEIFDGSQWHSIGLPKEFVDLPQACHLRVIGVAADDIFFGVRDWEDFYGSGLRVYKVDLSAQEWNLEYLCELWLDYVYKPE